MPTRAGRVPESPAAAPAACRCSAQSSGRARWATTAACRSCLWVSAHCACPPAGPVRLGPGACPWRCAVTSPAYSLLVAPSAGLRAPPSTRSLPAAPARPRAVLATTMLLSAVAAGAAHPDALASLLQHPSAGIAMLTAGDIPWPQVGGQAGSASQARKCMPAPCGAAWPHTQRPSSARCPTRCPTPRLPRAPTR